MSELLAALGAAWARWMLVAAWPATLIALVALLLVIPLARRRSPALALWAAYVALARCFLPPLPWPGSESLQAPDALSLDPALVASVAPHVAVALMVVHGAGVLACSAWMLRQRRALSHICAATRATPDCLEHELHDVADALGISRRPALLVSEAIDAPVAIGVRRPRILVPATLLALSKEDRRLVLAHELLHHKHRDLAVELALGVALAIWWFHPAVRALVARVRELREERCDDVVVARLSEPERYCRAILHVAASRLPAGAPAARHHAHPLHRRFARLLAAPARGRRSRAAAAMLVGVFVLVATLVGSASAPGAPATTQGDADRRVHVIRTQVVR